LELRQVGGLADHTMKVGAEDAALVKTCRSSIHGV